MHVDSHALQKIACLAKDELASEGFTLIELLFILCLLGMLAVMGLPSYGFLIQKNEQQTLCDEIKTITEFAKMKAIQTDDAVELLPLDPKLDWSKGLLLVQFDKKTKQMKSLHQWQWQHPHWRLQWSGVQSSQKICFSNNPVHAMSNGRFILSNTQTQEELMILLNRLGRVRSYKNYC